MNWVTVIWSMGAAASLTLAGVHLFVWSKDRAARLNLLLAVAAFSIAIFAMFEQLLMLARTPAQYAVLHRWAHVPMFFALVSLLGFLRFYFGSGRLWLLWMVFGLRLVVLGFVFLFQY